MATTKFTPGPWAVSTYSNYVGWSVYGPTGTGCLAERWYAYELSEEQNTQARANAHLIAAAPDLYEALDEITMHMRDIVETRKNGDLNNWNGYYVPLFEKLAAKYAATLAKAVR